MLYNYIVLNRTLQTNEDLNIQNEQLSLGIYIQVLNIFWPLWQSGPTTKLFGLMPFSASPYVPNIPNHIFLKKASFGLIILYVQILFRVMCDIHTSFLNLCPKQYKYSIGKWDLFLDIVKNLAVYMYTRDLLTMYHSQSFYCLCLDGPSSSDDLLKSLYEPLSPISQRLFYLSSCELNQIFHRINFR